MKVYELLIILQECDQDADVYIMSQQKWPFEHNIDGVTTREEIHNSDYDYESEDSEEEEMNEAEKLAKWPSWKDRWSAQEYELPSSDVFIVEGEQTRYGSKVAWNIV